MKIPKSWDELPYTFFEKNSEIFESFLKKPVHGDYRQMDLFGPTVCRTDIIPADARIFRDDFEVLTPTKPSVLITGWDTNRAKFGPLKLSQMAHDRFFEAKYIDDENAWEIVGMVNRRYLKSEYGVTFTDALIKAKLADAGPDKDGSVRLSRLRV